jgi:aspartate kinase
VLKFGGASLCDGAAVRRACELVLAHGGDRPIVIVSAVQGVTGILDGLARGEGDLRTVQIRHRTLLRQLGLSGELLDGFLFELGAVLELVRRSGGPNPSQRDYLLSFGERMSARIVAAALRASGLAATPVDAYDLGLVTDGVYGRARPLAGAAAAVRRAVAEVPGTPVVTGFLAADADGNLTTLGRNGSDLTALFVAEAVGASEVQLWKSVPGILTADPAAIPVARTIAEVGYDEALELALHGARVLHPEAVLSAQRGSLATRLLDTRHPERTGTSLVGTSADGPLALVHRAGLIRARVSTPRAEGLGALLAELERCDARTPWLELRAGEARLAVPDGAAREVLDRAGASLELGVAALALVGRRVGGDFRLAERALRRLRKLGVPVLATSIGVRDHSLAWLVPGDGLQSALAGLHAWLFEARAPVDRVDPVAAPARPAT